MDRAGQLSVGKNTHKKKMSKETLDIYRTYITISITLIPSAVHLAVL